jgi:hypothetical protein
MNNSDYFETTILPSGRQRKSKQTAVDNIQRHKNLEDGQKQIDDCKYYTKKTKEEQQKSEAPQKKLQQTTLSAFMMKKPVS